MSKLTDSFKEVLVHNSHGFYGRGHVFIAYSSATTGRGSRSAYWSVVRPGYETDPNAYFRDYGTKTFPVWARGQGTTLKEVRAEKLEEAKRWAEEKYGSVAEWKKDPYGSWGELTYVKARTKALKAKVAALPFHVGDKVQINGEGEIRVIRLYNGDGNLMLDGDHGYEPPYYTPAQFTKVGG